MENHIKYSKGVCWIEDCRIPFTTDDSSNINFDRPRLRNKEGTDWILSQAMDYTDPNYKEYNQQGRFTPNLLVCDDMLNDGNVSKSQRGRNDVGKPTYTGNSLLNSKTTMNNTDRGFDDKGTNSRYYDLDMWFDKMLEKL